MHHFSAAKPTLKNTKAPSATASAFQLFTSTLGVLSLKM